MVCEREIIVGFLQEIIGEREREIIVGICERLGE